MAEAIGYRGPDSHGTWADKESGLAFGHRRLAIIDLSPLGHQPMLSASGRFVISFNGEIYNYAALRKQLPGRYPFRGESDTEVMLAAIETWGLESAVEKFIGMFAFALWDRELRVLSLVRDRLGVKPLVYGSMAGGIVFASELRALRACPDFSPEVDRGSITLLLRHNCIPAPHTIYRNVYKLLPGHILTLAGPDLESARLKPYWSAREVALRGVAEPFEGTDAEGIDGLDELLREAVGLRMIADVPLGAFLSGGIDSSMVAALMQAQSGRPVKTFTIGSLNPEYDEAQHARDVARHLGTEHTELYVTPEDALAVIPRLSGMFDEPFADSSQIPTFLVSQLARREVTVSLSGDGGDELFAGYNRHVWGKRVWDLSRRFPQAVRNAAAGVLTSVPPTSWDRLFRTINPLLPRSLHHRMPGYKLQKLAGLLSSNSPDELYRRLSSHWIDPEDVTVGAVEPAGVSADPAYNVELGEVVAQMMYLDLITYLPNDILTKVDRASMAVSLEARVPLLDHRVVEFAWRLPLSMKIRDGQSKWALRQVLYRYVPRELIERPKAGFGIPLEAWLRGPLRGWAEELLDERRLRREGYFDPALVREKWATHLSGRQDLQYDLWDVLMFQAWLEGEPTSGSPASDIRTPAVAAASLN
jgi:asparagine synthase (glutamine-hydrolysing)